VPASDYQKRKTHFDRQLTLFGRNPVMEALQSAQVVPVRLHLADSNKPSPQLETMRQIAIKRGAVVVLHNRQALARISKNGRQDQGVALDIETPGFRPLDSLPELSTATTELVALDHITNPANVGMIIRTLAASPMAGVIMPRHGGAWIDPLVIKASAGAVFRATIYHCDALESGLLAMKAAGFRILGLAAGGRQAISTVPLGKNIFVLGNETEGLSSNVRACCDDLVSIPLKNDVESLNVSIAASIVAFRSIFAGHHADAGIN
jgi:23S rRNA (guanosine2251-2'-O)-methyltransferase